jgi:hypothetical protein
MDNLRLEVMELFRTPSHALKSDPDAVSGVEAKVKGM